ncbi:MAG: sulfotransferase, partial [Actinomycetota bacterium]|nr:sulfotransferase [Actinomycetota bacterium]
LNDDTEVISGGWLEAMLEHAQRSEVGAVGARLLYPDGRVQHAGVLVGVGNPWGPGVALHSHQFYAAQSPGYAGMALTTTNYSAVTAACILMRRSVFEEVGGLDEENLRVSFNDVDLCLKIRERGYLITYTPHAELLHHESVSRGHSGGNPSESLYMRERWGSVMDGDPYYNRSFSRGSGDFNLRADLLRPRALRRPPDRPEESFLSPLTTDRERLTEQVKARQRKARSSSRSAVVPSPGIGNGKSPVVESLELLRDPDRPEAEAAPVVRAPGPEALREEQLVWIFGSPRTGSTWLSRIMAELNNQERWHEPYVGLLFGSFIYERLGENSKLLNNPSFIMGEAHREVWLRSIKQFVVEGAKARYPRLGHEQYLVIKEPNGSVGAPLLMEATPRSRMVFLIRDPRDVVASRLDALREGSWSSQQRDYSKAEELNAFTRHLAEEYLKVVSQVQRAYDAHPGIKTLVRYEDLRYDTAGTMDAMYRALGIAFDRDKLEAAVAKHSWERIPTTDKGSGKFYRKARPGSWKEDLSADQASLVEGITASVLNRYYRPGTPAQTLSG